MMYIQLSLPYRNYDKALIKSFYVYENSIGVTYAIKNNNNELFEKTFHITEDMPEYANFLNSIPNSNFTTIDNIHKLILEFMISKNIETGTLEVE